MADEGHVVRGIQWREAFPFTNLFRTFRIAIHPSKLVLGLLALLSLYLGGRILDTIWPAKSLAVPGEVSLFQRWGGTEGGDTFDIERDAQRESIEEQYASTLIRSGVETDPAKARDAADKGDRFGDLKTKVHKDLESGYTEIAKEYDAVVATNPNKETLDRAKAARDQQQRQLRESAEAELSSAARVRGRGIFAEFFEYEVEQINGVVAGVLSWNWLGGGGGEGSGSGVIPSIVNFFTVGPVWLLREHTLYFILFTLLFLLVWSIFGGAIARIAAVHVARDEKISVRQALRFSIGKLLSFIFAPIIPLIIVLVVGVVVTVVALIGYIPVLGPIVIGAAFFLALIAGFVMALVLLGTAGGFNLMYPTIAVEGSDSFDAISRSFSYVYARPWRMLFYTLIAVIYGALTYLFVRLFVWLMMVLTHYFVSLGFQADSVSGIDAWQLMWPRPDNIMKLSYEIPWTSLSTGQRIGAWLVAFWNYLAIGMIGAFAISFYFSANTIIYYLMRHEVDATEMDDVFIEQSEEEITDSAATTSGPLTSTATGDTTSGASTGPLSTSTTTTSGTTITTTTTAATPADSDEPITPPDPTGPAARSSDEPPAEPR